MIAKNLQWFVSLILVGCFVSTGCSVGRIYPKFTTVNNLTSLRGNLSLTEVVTSLGCKPNDLLIRQGDGYSIYSWEYKANRDFYTKLEQTLPIQKKEIRKLSKGLHRAYLIFDDSNGLSAIITDAGIADGIQLVVFDNSFKSGNSDSQSIWLTKKALTEGVSKAETLNYQQILDLIDRYFEGDESITAVMIFEAIDAYFN